MPISITPYSLYGPPAAPGLLLVHGSTVSRASWVQQIEDLGRDYRLVVVDLPGHGVLAAEPFRLERAVAVLQQAVDEAANGCALLMGLSLGGHVATLFAARYPQQTAGLVISGASMDFHGLTGAWTRLVGWLMLRLFSEQKLRLSLEQKIRTHWPAAVVSAQLAEGVYPLGAAQSFIELPKYNFRAELARVTAPLLILNGELDRPNRQGERAFTAAAPHARLAVIAGTGHACAIEKPAEFNARLRAFAAEIGWTAISGDTSSQAIPEERRQEIRP